MRAAGNCPAIVGSPSSNVDKRRPPVVSYSSGVESLPAAVDSSAAVGNWLTVAYRGRLMTVAAGSCPATADSPSSTVDKRPPPVVVNSSGVASSPAAVDSSAAVGNWLTVACKGRPMTAAADSWPTVVDKPVPTAAADKPAKRRAAGNSSLAAGSSAPIAPAAGSSPAAPAGSSRAAVDSRPAPAAADNWLVVGSRAAAAARLLRWRSPAARMPRVLRRFLCPYRRPRTQWDCPISIPWSRVLPSKD
jgi:hypothetical protein